MNTSLLSTRDEPIAFKLLQTWMGETRGPPRMGGGETNGEIKEVEKEMEDILFKAKVTGGVILRKNAESIAIKLRDERDGRADWAIRELAAV
jgi:hypothetical protein